MTAPDGNMDIYPRGRSRNVFERQVTPVWILVVSFFALLGA